MKKVLSILLVITMVIAMGATSAFALTSPSELKPSQDPTSTGTITNIGQRIMGTIQVVGIVIAVVILMVIGIKYMMGSAEEKAEYKKTMIPYIVGAVLIFAASTLANMAYQFATSING